MITENVSTLKIHKLTQEQYNTALAAGNLDENALYLTPDADGTAIPTKVSDLENDAGYITADAIPSPATATGTTSGIVKLSDATDSDSGVDDGVAATPLAVKNVAQAVIDYQATIASTCAALTDQYETDNGGYMGSQYYYPSGSEYCCISIGGILNGFSTVQFDIPNGSYKFYDPDYYSDMNEGYTIENYQPYTVSPDVSGTYDFDITVTLSNDSTTNVDYAKFMGIYVYSRSDMPDGWFVSSAPSGYKAQIMPAGEEFRKTSVEYSLSVRVPLEAGDVIVAIIDICSTASDVFGIPVSPVISGNILRVA